MSQWSEDGVRRSRRKIERDTAPPTPAQLGEALCSLSGLINRTGIVDNEATETILTMIDKGGKSLLLADKRDYFPMGYNDFNGSFSLIFLLHKAIPVEIIYKMIEVGGKELVMRPINSFSSLMIALQYDKGFDLISKLIEIGGKELVMVAANSGNTILHYFNHHPTSLEILKLIINVGGREILCKKNNDGYLPVQKLVESGPYEERRKFNKIIMVLIKEGIHHSVGDEFSVGGLLHDCHKDKSDTHFEAFWCYRLFPVLMEAYRLLQVESPDMTPPLLHSMIKFKAPKSIIWASLFELEGLVSIKDTKGRDALDFAIEMNLSFDKGMREILEFTAKTNGLDILHCAAQHGLPWKNGMKRLVELNLNYALYGVNEKTGLKLFMTAAVGSNLDTIYSLIRMDPMSMLFK